MQPEELLRRLKFWMRRRYGRRRAGARAGASALGGLRPCSTVGSTIMMAAGSAVVREQLAALPSRLGRHKRYRAIDRRFDGPKHLRTRDYDSDDDCW